MANVLIIDDDKMICETLSRRISTMGNYVATALNLKEGLHSALSEAFDLVFLDVRLPDGNGLSLLPTIRETPSRPEVIIITAEGDPDGAELAIKNGAWDYIQKPFTKEEVTLQLERALQYHDGEKGKNTPVALKRERLIGNSPAINACLDLLAQAAHSDANVLITGETGTGKEVFAQAIHANSPRKNKDFIIVDCTVLPEKLVESVLFGHKKGAFTGADEDHDGLVKQADGGVLFLDEVGELPWSIQRAFLRVLQEHRFRPVGGKQEETSDFRLIAATNRDLNRMSESGQFRQDLLFRLQTFTIELPPLRERIEDIKDISIYHIASLCERKGMETKGFSPDFFNMLANYSWPGNVRELVNTRERAIAVVANNPVLYAKHLPNDIRAKMVRASVAKKTGSRGAQMKVSSLPNQLPTLKDLREKSISEMERKYLQDLMALTRGNIKEACRVSGLSRARLYELRKKHNISKSN